ncbi:MAG: hypothetical protein JSR44_15380 [Spirochaetes bacterium]|nr:hypothetical protein [Spirochaetota bacterium]
MHYIGFCAEDKSFSDDPSLKEHVHRNRKRIYSGQKPYALIEVVKDTHKFITEEKEKFLELAARAQEIQLEIE